MASFFYEMGKLTASRPFFISLTRKRSLRSLGGPPGPLSPSGFAPILMNLRFTSFSWVWVQGGWVA